MRTLRAARENADALNKQRNLQHARGRQARPLMEVFALYVRRGDVSRAPGIVLRCSVSLVRITEDDVLIFAVEEAMERTR